MSFLKKKKKIKLAYHQLKLNVSNSGRLLGIQCPMFVSLFTVGLLFFPRPIDTYHNIKYYYVVPIVQCAGYRPVVKNKAYVFIKITINSIL